MILGSFESQNMRLPMVRFGDGKISLDWFKPVFVGLHKSEIVMDRRPDRSCGLDRSIIFPVLISYGLVWSRSFFSLETGPSNTTKGRGGQGNEKMTL
jgi:hypothetical protein